MLKIDDEFCLSADQQNFRLVRKRKAGERPGGKEKKNDTVEETVGYFISVESAIRRYRRERMRDWVEHDRMTLETLCDRIQKMDEELARKLDRLKELVPAKGKSEKTRKRGEADE